MQGFMTKQGVSLCFLLTSLILINSQAVYAGATHSPSGEIGIDVTSPAHQERLSALPVQVKITFGIPLNTATFSAKMNGQDVTERFTVTELGATASLNVHDGIRPSLDKNGKLKDKAPNLLQIEGRAKDTHKPYHATRHFFLNASDEPAKVVATITPAGGTITLPGYGSVAFPAGAFTHDQAVALSATSDPITADEFDVSSALYDVGVRLPYELRIDTGSQQGPATNVAVTFEVPQTFSAQVPADSGLQVMAQFWGGGSAEVLDYFEGFEQPLYTAADKRVTVQLPPEAFTNQRNIAGTYEAIVVLTSARLAQSSVSSTSANQHGPPVYTAGGISRLAKLSLAAQSFFSRITEFFFSSATAATTAVCTGLRRFGPPLDGNLKITDSFNRKNNHFGTDYATRNENGVAITGKPVKAMGDGFIQKIAFNEYRLSKPDPRSGSFIKGWGQYIIVKHPDGAQTLYAHLERNSNTLRMGDPVNKGDVIARSGQTGGASAPHLHIEYSPNGKILQKEFKADPDPCLDSTSGILPLSYGWSSFLTQGPYFDTAEAAAQYVCNLVVGGGTVTMSITITGTVGTVACVGYFPDIINPVHIVSTTQPLYYVAYCPAGYTQGADSCIRNN